MQNEKYQNARHVQNRGRSRYFCFKQMLQNVNNLTGVLPVVFSGEQYCIKHDGNCKIYTCKNRLHLITCQLVSRYICRKPSHNTWDIHKPNKMTPVKT